MGYKLTAFVFEAKLSSTICLLYLQSWGGARGGGQTLRGWRFKGRGGQPFFGERVGMFPILKDKQKKIIVKIKSFVLFCLPQ
jgi:hypothetical protein